MLLIHCSCEAGSLDLPYLDTVTCLPKWKTVKVDCIYFNEVRFYLPNIVPPSVTWESSVFKSWWRRMCALLIAAPPQLSCSWVGASDQTQPSASLPQNLWPGSMALNLIYLSQHLEVVYQWSAGSLLNQSLPIVFTRHHTCMSCNMPDQEWQPDFNTIWLQFRICSFQYFGLGLFSSLMNL